MSKRMSVLLAVVVGVLGGALVAGSALIGASAQPGSVSTSAPAVAGADHAKSCGWRFKRLPAELRADLKAARALPAGERRPALRKIVRAARAGDYGKRVQRIAQKRLHRHKVVWSKLPADLRADLKKVRHLPLDERKAARQEIRKDALAGEYGTSVQKFAEHRKEHRAKCRAGSRA